VVKQIEIPQIQTIEKIVEVPYIQTVEKIVEIPQVGETVQGNQRSVTQQLETMRQMAPAETVQEVVEGPPMPMESMTPVLKASAGDMMGAMGAMGGQAGGVDLGAGSQMVYGAPGTMTMSTAGATGTTAICGGAPGTITMPAVGAPGTIAMSAGGASQFSMQGTQSIVGSQMLGAPPTAVGMPGQLTTMAFPGQMMAGGATATGQAVSTFDALDRNHDGVLSREEFAQGQTATTLAGASFGGGSVFGAAPVLTMDGQQPVTALPTTYGAPGTVYR